jgi:hypothetical protein
MKWLIFLVMCIVCLLAILKSNREQVPTAVPPETTTGEPVTAVITNELAAEPGNTMDESTNITEHADVPRPIVEQANIPMTNLLALIRLQSGIKVPHDIGDLPSLDGRIYKSVTVTRIEPDGISFRHSGGSAKLGLGLLPADLEVKYHIKKESAALYTQEINRRKQVVLLAKAEQQARNQQASEQEELQRQSQRAEEQRVRTARAMEDQRDAARAAWAQYERDMQEYHRLVREVEMRKMRNRNLIVKMPVEPAPPSVPKP